MLPKISLAEISSRKPKPMTGVGREADFPRLQRGGQQMAHYDV
jgi:hypothetical protein